MAVLRALGETTLTPTLGTRSFSPAGWHAKLGEGAIADAVIDRIVYRSDVIHIEGDESMRKRIG